MGNVVCGEDIVCLLTILVAVTDWGEYPVWNRDSPWRGKAHVGRPVADFLQHALRELPIPSCLASSFLDLALTENQVGQYLSDFLWPRGLLY